MRILHLISTMSPAYGGPTTVVQQICAGLIGEGHATEIACLDSPGAPGLRSAAEWRRESSLDVHMIGPSAGRFGYTRKLIPWIEANASRFDCIIVHGIWQYFSQAAWRALRATKVPYFVYVHGGLGLWFRQAHPVKHLKKALYWRLIEHRVLRDARAVFFACEEERRQAGRLFRPYRCNEQVINFGINEPAGDAEGQRRAFLARFPELSDKRLLVHLSRFHPVKACDLLIEAFAAVAREDASLHLVMAGPDQGPYRYGLRRRAEALGIGPRITWTGLLQGELKWGALQTAEAFAFPSHYESFGMAVVEALACGIPVLISNQVPIWREIEEDGAGLVGVNDLEGTRQMLRSWLETPRPRRMAMRENAKRCFIHRFEIERATASLVNALRTHGVEG